MAIPLPNLTLQLATTSEARAKTQTGDKTFNFAGPGASVGGLSLPVLLGGAAVLFLMVRKRK